MIKLLVYLIGFFSEDQQARLKRLLYYDRAFHALSEICNYMRREDKYIDQTTTEQAEKISEIRDAICNIIYDENGINLDELYF